MNTVQNRENILKEAKKVAIVMMEGEAESIRPVIRLCKCDEGEFLHNYFCLEFSYAEIESDPIKEILNSPNTLIMVDDESAVRFIKTNFGVEKEIFFLSDFSKPILKGHVEDKKLLENLYDIASVFCTDEEIDYFYGLSLQSELFRRVINFLLHFERLCYGIRFRNEHNQFIENLIEFRLDKKELELAGCHMFMDDNDKIYFAAVKEKPYESIYLDTQAEDSYDDLIAFLDTTDVLCGYGLSDEILFFVSKTSMDKGIVPHFPSVDTKDLLYELFEISEDMEKELNYLYLLNRLLIKGSFTYLYEKPGLEVANMHIIAARKMAEMYKNSQHS